MGARPVLAAMLTVAAASEIRTTTATVDSRIPLNVAPKSAKVNAPLVTHARMTAEGAQGVPDVRADRVAPQRVTCVAVGPCEPRRKDAEGGGVEVRGGGEDGRASPPCWSTS